MIYMDVACRTLFCGKKKNSPSASTYPIDFIKTAKPGDQDKVRMCGCTVCTVCAVCMVCVWCVCVCVYCKYECVCCKCALCVAQTHAPLSLARVALSLS